MTTRAPHELPDYLKDLLQPTPSSIEKLLAAWDGLSVETQAAILLKLDKVPTPVYLIERVETKALSSHNAYIRYLAAHRFNSKNNYSSKDKELREMIENDSSPLVKYSHFENLSEITSVFLDDDDLKDADSFFALPHQARLAKVRMLRGYGEKVTGILEEAAVRQLQDGSVSETELYEIITDYLVKPKFRTGDADNHLPPDDCDHEGDNLIQRLWQLVPLLPPRIAQVLVDNLPKLSQPHCVPENVIKAMTINQLESLLDRQDIELVAFRKKIFREDAELRGAAVRSHFTLDYSEFAEILAGAPQERVATLKLLGTMAPDLELCLYEAIHDVVIASDGSGTVTSFESSLACGAMARRLKELEQEKKYREFDQLRLYRLARTAVPWEPEAKGSPPVGSLKFLADNIVPGDTWGTFMAFSQVWPQRGAGHRVLVRELPRLYDLGEDDLPREESESDRNALVRMDDELSRGIADILEEVKTLRKELTDEVENIGRQTGEQRARLDHEIEARTLMQQQISRVRRKRLFTYIPLGMCGFIILLLYATK